MKQVKVLKIRVWLKNLLKIQANNKEETDELFENVNEIDDLTKPLV